MLDSIDSSSRSFLLALDRLDQKLDRAQRQLSSGKRIATASDAPDQVSELLAVRGDIARNQQIQADLASYKTETDVAANALDRASSVLDRVKSLTSIALNGSLSAAMQANLAQQLQDFTQDMVGIANTQVNGRYIFSGDNDRQAAYALDLTRANGVSAYLGTASTRQAQGPDGSTFDIAKDGQEIFDSAGAGASVFTALADLRNAIWNNSAAAIQSALTGIQSAQDHLRTESVFYGMAQNRVSQATDDATARDQQLDAHRGSIEGADITASILELQDAQFQRQAALAARAKVPPTSLFDYIK